MADLNLRTPNGYDGQPGTIYKMGIVRLATPAEAAEASSNRVALTPVDAVAAIPDATTTVKGKVELATDAEAVTGTDNTNKAIIPSSLTARLASPGPIGGTLAAAGSFTTLATSGDYTATTGNIIINSAAKQLRVHGGAVTDFIGTATLVNGTVTVANTNIAAGDRIFVERSAANASTAFGVFKVVKSAGVNFVVTACKPADGTTETGDLSTVDYFIVRQV